VRGYLREVLELLDGERQRLPWLVLVFVAASLLDLLGVGLTGPYIALVMSSAVPGGFLGEVIHGLGFADRRSAIVGLGLVLLAVFALKTVAAIGIHRLIIRFSQQQQAALQSRLMGAYQRMPYAKFLQRNSSEYLVAIQSLAEDFAHVVQMGLRTVSDSLVLVMLLALLAWQDASALALLVALFATVVVGYDRTFRRRLQGYGEDANRGAAEVVQGAQEGIAGFKEIRILGKEAHFHAKVQRGAAAYARAFTASHVIALAPRYILELTLVAFVVIHVFAMLWLGAEPATFMPTLGMFAVAALRLMPAANTVSGALVQIRYGRDSVARLHRDLHGAFVPEGVPQTQPPEPFATLELEDVGFTFPGAAFPALDHVTLRIERNASIGLIGASGSGKTTLVDVLLGLLEPQQGRIRYNGRPLKEALASWRARVAYLPQDVFLTDASLRSNVALGVEEPAIDERRLATALHQARLDELVARLPQGAATLVGERGMRLSGGERQRVALARAFYHGRDVLVMDEATSALDTETEREIVEEIRQLRGEKTLIVIAHRLGTVRHCERVYRLERGRIVEGGSYEAIVGHAS